MPVEDTNVLLDFVTQREGFVEACDIFQLGEEGKVNLCVSYLTMANTAYVARRGRMREELYGTLSELAEMLEILAMDDHSYRRLSLYLLPTSRMSCSMCVPSSLAVTTL